MENNDGLSVIHKKARVAREDFDARAMSPAKALRLAFAQAAEDRLDMALTVSTLEQTRVNTATLTAGLAEDALLILLDGAGGRPGAAIFDPQLVAALIEKQVTGAVREGAARPRAYTRTDAAMMAPLLDAGLTGADALLAAEQEGHAPGQFRFGDKVEDIRVLSLALQGLEFDVFQMTVSIENGLKSGTLSLALPVSIPLPSASCVNAENAARPTASLKKLAMDAPVTLNAVLSRIRRPLDEICMFKPGMLLPVAHEAIDQAELMARPRYLVAEGRLGQVGGMRAVRIRLAQADSQPTRPLPPHAETLSAAQGLESDPTHMTSSALDTEPELQTPVAALDFDIADGTDTDLPELSDLGRADLELSQWEGDPEDTEKADHAGELSMPEPLP